MDFLPTIVPICMPAVERTFSNSIGQIAGWGYSNFFEDHEDMETLGHIQSYTLKLIILNMNVINPTFDTGAWSI